MDRDRGRELWRERKSVTIGKYFYVGDRANKKPKYATCSIPRKKTEEVAGRTCRDEALAIVVTINTCFYYEATSVPISLLFL